MPTQCHTFGKAEKMGPLDDPEAFLIPFKRVAVIVQRPKEIWDTLLVPYLTGQDSMVWRG